MTDQDLKLIEDYIDGKLTGEALVLFDNKINSDKAFAKEYKLRVGIDKLWNEADEYEQTKSEITSVLSKNKISFYHRKSYYFLSIAASIIILGGIYFILFHKNNSDNLNNNTYANAKDSTTSVDSTITFQYDEPNSYAQVDSVYNGTTLLSPIDGESFGRFETIMFIWTSSNTDSDTLFISKSGNTVLKLNIKGSDTAISIQYPQFVLGNYIWYISDTTQTGTFNITNK